MKVYVVFEFPDVTDVDSHEADAEIAILNDVLNGVFKHEGLASYIDEVTE